MDKSKLKEAKKKIISILKERGPSLPVHIARGTGLDMLFASAFLAELVSEKSIRVSHLKIGGSPLYFLSGQKKQLENFSKHLPAKEKEALENLKKKGILKDSDQPPGIRVGLRNIKDFAIPFKLNQNGKEVYWRFYSFPKNEAIKKAEGRGKQKEEDTEKKEEKPKEVREKPLLELKENKEEDTEKKEEKPKENIKNEEENEKESKERESNKKQKEDVSKFVEEVRNFLSENNVQILEENKILKKRYNAEVQIDTDLGKMKYLCFAKEKKRVTKNDIALAAQKAQEDKTPILFITPGKLSKKAKEYLENYLGFIRLKKI